MGATIWLLRGKGGLCFFPEDKIMSPHSTGKKWPERYNK
jgi:hypothetical protein